MLSKIVSFIIVCSLISLAVSYYFKNIPPDYTQISSQLQEEPVQSKILYPEEFELNYQGETYTVTPKFNYQIAGLVASHNNINAFADIYHDDKSVDTKDLCLIWGLNIESNDFHKVSIKNGAWTCYFSWKEQIKFSRNMLSNNHLITSDDEIREKIADIRKWDQVSITGMLVDYSPKSNPSFVRSTSTVRTDDGCEVIYVTDLQILKRANVEWNDIYTYSKYTALVLLLLKIAEIIFPAKASFDPLHKKYNAR